MTSTTQINDLISGYTDLKRYFEDVQKDIDGQLKKWTVQDKSTIYVGPTREFKDIGSAFNSLHNKMLSQNILIKVDDGLYETTGILLTDQPYAHRIRIVGNVANPEKCVIQFIPDANKRSHGLMVRGIQRMHMAGFRLVGETTENNWTHRCLRLECGAVLYCDDNSIQISNSGNGVELDNASYLQAIGLKIEQCAAYGIYCGGGSTLLANQAQIIGKGKEVITTCGDVNFRSSGCLATDNSKAWCGSSHLSNCYQGFYSARNSYLWCDQSIVDTAHFGFMSEFSGLLNNWSSSNKKGKAINCINGFVAQEGSYLVAPWTIAENCTTGYYADGQSRLTANDSQVLNCKSGYLSYAMSLIDCLETNAKAVGTTTIYSPSTSGVVANQGAMVRYS